MQALPIRNLIVALAFAGLAGVATAKTALIDFNNTSGSDATANPSGGLHYNNANLPANQTTNGAVLINGGASLALVDDSSAASGWSLGISKGGAGGVGASGSGANYAGPYPAAVSGFAASALKDGAFINNSATLTLTFSGLNAGKKYDFLTYGARGNSGTVQPYTLVAGTSASPTSVSFNPLNNSTVAPAWSAVSPTAGGVIALEITATAGSGPVQALNFIRLEETTPAPVPVITSFTVADHYVAPGTPVTFTWNSSLATTLSISPSIGDVMASSTGGGGSIVINAPATTGATTYTLTATNEFGSSTSTLRLGHGPDRPNILFFLVDDMGWQDTSVPLHYDTSGNPILGTYNTRYKTPAMETLAAQGRKFTNAYACTVCSPSRVSIMTGMNSARHHVTNWTKPVSPGVEEYNNDAPGVSQPPDWRMAGMDATDIPLPKLLQDVGYRTIHVGKAHFGPDSEPSGDPRFIGFDVNIAGHGAGGPGSYLGTQNFSGAWRGAESYWDVPGLEQYHGQDIFLTEALTLEMNKQIEQAVDDGSPFFAYMSHYAVHVPWTNDARFTAKYPTLSGQELAFATTIEGMDQSLRDITQKLNDLNVAKDTLVIFYSDNGSDLRDGSESSVLRGLKGTQWEGGMRVPLIVGWAKIDAGNPFQAALNIPQNSREDAIVSPEDMFPTVASIAGVSYSHPVDGFDLSPYFTGTPGEHRPQQFLHHFPHGHGSDHFTVFREGDWKLIYSYRSGGPIRQLYNLATDIGETNNRATAEPEKLMSLNRKMARELHRYGAQFSVITATGQPIPPTMPILSGVDLDQDGISDNAEDPNHNGLVDPGETDPDDADSDGDGINDGAELALGLNPINPNSFFYLTSTRQPDGSMVLEWPSKPGSTFRISASPDLADWSETIATDYPASASGTTTTYNLGISSQAQRFFRVSFTP